MTEDLAVFRALREADSLQAVWALLVGHFNARGFGAVAYLLFDRGRASRVLAFLDDGFPPEVVSTFAALGYGRNAPLVRIAMASGAPQLGSRIDEDHRFSREEMRHREKIVAAGLKEALAFPLYGPQGRDAVAFAAEARSPALYGEVEWGQLHMVAQMAHLRILAVSPDKDEVHSLSGREVEILRWVAQGKSNSVISEILGISVTTVDTYLRRVFEKLGVADRTSAAVRGVSLGLIRA